MKILFKLVITRMAVFSSKCTQNRLSAGLRPDPLGSLQRSSDPLAGFKGGLLLRKGRARKGGKGREEEGRKGRGEERREGDG